MGRPRQSTTNQGCVNKIGGRLEEINCSLAVMTTGGRILLKLSLFATLLIVADLFITSYFVVSECALNKINDQLSSPSRTSFQMEETLVIHPSASLV